MQQAGRWLGEVFFFSSAQSTHRLVCHRRGEEGEAETQQTAEEEEEEEEEGGRGGVI